jgi:hypothetical protein
VYFHGIVIPNIAPKPAMFASPHWTMFPSPNLVESIMFPDCPGISIWGEVFPVIGSDFNIIRPYIMKIEISDFPNGELSMITTRKMFSNIFEYAHIDAKYILLYTR